MLLFFFEELDLQYHDRIEVIGENGISSFGHYLGEHDIGADTFLFLNAIKGRKKKIVISKIENIIKVE
ncbi:MAG: hypothetical protein V4561_02725 [Bacteroidota bacterium]